MPRLLFRSAPLILLFCATLVYAKQLPLRVYDRDHGLDNMSVTALTRDARGDLWGGTERGLYRYDGQKFVDISAQADFRPGEVTALAAIPGGGLWVATRSGLWRGQAGRFVQIRWHDHAILVDRGQTLSASPHQLLLIRSKQLMRLDHGTDGQWRLTAVFSAGQIDARTALGQIHSIERDGDTVWFGCGGHLCRRHTGTLEVFDTTRGLPDAQWRGLLVTDKGDLWARSPTRIVELPRAGGHFIDRQMPGSEGEVAATNLPLAEAPDHAILTRSSQGLARWDGRGWQTYASEDGLPSTGVSAISAQPDGSIWLGAYGQGVMRWNGYGVVDNWTTSQGLGSPLIWSIAHPDPNHVWVAHDMGGNVIDIRTGKVSAWPLSLPAPLQARTLLSLPGGDLLLFLFDGRVLRYNHTDGTTETLAKVPDFVRTGFRDRQGRLWATGVSGLYRILADGKVMPQAEDIVDHGLCSDLAEDTHGVLWAACSAGLLRYDGRHWQRMHETSPHDGGYEHVASDDDGQLWLSSLQPGLFSARVDGDRLHLQPVDDALLRKSRFYFLRTDNQGRMWAGNDHGVDVFDHGHWKRLDRNDGLVWEEMDHNAFLADADGSVWLGTPGGVSDVKAPDTLLDRAAPTVRLVSAQYGTRTLQPTATDLKLPANQSLRLKLAASGNDTGHPLQYRYRLDGIDPHWITTLSPDLRYPLLPPGHYTFHAQVIDVDQRRASPSTGFSLTVMPPWWASYWAIFCYALLLAAVIFALWRWRVRRLVRRATALEQAVTARTRELEREKRQLEITQANLSYQARHDELTGLLNRPAVLAQLRAWRQKPPSSHGMAIALLDLDHFKHINDSYGHLAGDRVLSWVGRMLRVVLPTACCGRYGGEEFLILLPADSEADAVAQLEFLLAELSRQTPAIAKGRFTVTASLGMTWTPPNDINRVDTLLDRADRGLYTAKARGRAQVVSGEE